MQEEDGIGEEVGSRGKGEEKKRKKNRGSGQFPGEKPVAGAERSDPLQASRD